MKSNVLLIMHAVDNAPQFIGSYSFDAYTSSNGELLNIISDSKSRRSLLLHIPKKNKSRKESKYMGNTYQFYIWKSKNEGGKNYA